jgi:hypothetical protein
MSADCVSEEVGEIVWDNMKERVDILAEDGRAELQ